MWHLCGVPFVIKLSLIKCVMHAVLGNKAHQLCGSSSNFPSKQNVCIFLINVIWCALFSCVTQMIMLMEFVFLSFQSKVSDWSATSQQYVVPIAPIYHLPYAYNNLIRNTFYLENLFQFTFPYIISNIRGNNGTKMNNKQQCFIKQNSIHFSLLSFWFPSRSPSLKENFEEKPSAPICKERYWKLLFQKHVYRSLHISKFCK